MTKIYIDVNNVNSVCRNHLAQVNSNVSSALSNLNSVVLPFSCGNLSSSISSLNDANSLIKDTEQKIRKATDFVSGNENEITSQLGQIAVWKLPI